MGGGVKLLTDHWQSAAGQKWADRSLSDREWTGCESSLDFFPQGLNEEKGREARNLTHSVWSKGRWSPGSGFSLAPGRAFHFPPPFHPLWHVGPAIRESVLLSAPRCELREAGLALQRPGQPSVGSPCNLQASCCLSGADGQSPKPRRGPEPAGLGPYFSRGGPCCLVLACTPGSFFSIGF